VWGITRALSFNFAGPLLLEENHSSPISRAKYKQVFVFYGNSLFRLLWKRGKAKVLKEKLQETVDFDPKVPSGSLASIQD
jgi:hypothetical protein